MRAPRLAAALLSLACLACSGANDPSRRDADGDGVTADRDCDDRDRAVWQAVQAYPDHDGDGFGVGPAETVCAGAMLPAGFAPSGTDCDDARGGLWRLTSAWSDTDGDGVGAGQPASLCIGGALPPGRAAVGGDCAPDDPARWRPLGYLHRDADGDGITVSSAGTVCAGAALPAGYAMEAVGSDCDDGDPLAFAEQAAYRDADFDGWGGGAVLQVCGGVAPPIGHAVRAGDCAPEDGTRWRTFTATLIDGDGDGYALSVAAELCIGDQLQAPYVATAWGLDCDDTDPARHLALAGYLDADGDGVGSGALVSLCTDGALPPGHTAVGGDCAPDDPARWRGWAYLSRDADGDGHWAASEGTVCGGDARPAGYRATGPDEPPDCDDADPAVFLEVAAYADQDGDGVGAGPPLPACTAGGPPAGLVAAGSDCAPDDPGRWQQLLAAGVDGDGDGVTAPGPGWLCSGAALPAPYLARATGNDCDDADPGLTRWEVLYRDQDGDGVGAPPRRVWCLGAGRPAGWSLLGFDPDDADTAVQQDAELESLLHELL